MKRCLSIFLILVLLLPGCGRDPQETKPSGDEQTQSSGVSENTEPTAPPQDPEPDLGLYEPDSAVEQATDGAVRKYALEGTGFYAVAVMGEGVLLFSGNQDTTLTYVLRADAFEGLLPGIMSQLSLFERFYVFVNGMFDWTAVVYYASVIGFFLFLTVQSMEKRRYN